MRFVQIYAVPDGFEVHLRSAQYWPYWPAGDRPRRPYGWRFTRLNLVPWPRFSRGPNEEPARARIVQDLEIDAKEPLPKEQDGTRFSRTCSMRPTTTACFPCRVRSATKFSRRSHRPELPCRRGASGHALSASSLRPACPPLLGRQRGSGSESSKAWSSRSRACDGRTVAPLLSQEPPLSFCQRKQASVPRKKEAVPSGRWPDRAKKSAGPIADLPQIGLMRLRLLIAERISDLLKE
jgi:hypothetical protein